jgi:hypothetical protein
MCAFLVNMEGNSVLYIQLLLLMIEARKGMERLIFLLSISRKYKNSFKNPRHLKPPRITLLSFL